MHNIHFVKVKANSGEEACQVVENLLVDFGTDNNWREFCGAISEDNEIFNSGEGRFEPKDTNYQSIEKINEKFFTGFFSKNFLKPKVCKRIYILRFHLFIMLM